MNSRAETGVTKNGQAYARLVEQDFDVLIMKAYLSPDGEKLRIVLPELVDMSQTKIDPDNHIIEFSRKSLKEKTR